MTASASTYAGDISAQEAWELLRSEPRAQLVDVRTAAEWTFVGVPELSELKRSLHTVEWQSFPSMALNPAFAQQTESAVLSAGGAKDAPVLFICRSGARSRSAAIEMTRAGFTKAFNVAGGFEGDLDNGRHRGNKNGWKAAELPWRQT